MEKSPISSDPLPLREQTFETVSLAKFDQVLTRRAKLHQRVTEGEYTVRFKDWTGEHRTIAITGTAVAITAALGGLYALQRHRKKN